jgi:hypothetical protein
MEPDRPSVSSIRRCTAPGCPIFLMVGSINLTTSSQKGAAEATRDHKITHDAPAIDSVFVTCFLGARKMLPAKAATGEHRWSCRQHRGDLPCSEGARGIQHESALPVSAPRWRTRTVLTPQPEAGGFTDDHSGFAQPPTSHLGQDHFWRPIQ